MPPRNCSRLSYFNPRAPCGARLRHMLREKAPRNFNPRAPCGARPPRGATSRRLADISIHAPRVGRDMTSLGKVSIIQHFNPRAPCGARPCLRCHCQRGCVISIHAPRVGRDRWGKYSAERRDGISIHAPRVGRDYISYRRRWYQMISIHAPRVGRDMEILRNPITSEAFQSTRPVWGATLRQDNRHRGQRHFNPRAPCGARPITNVDDLVTEAFQSTRPVWGATAAFPTIVCPPPNFNPRAPCGARHSRARLEH